MLKFTKAKIHLITDPNMLFTIIRGIRGGECQVIYHHAIANNKFQTLMKKQTHHHLISA